MLVSQPAEPAPAWGDTGWGWGGCGSATDPRVWGRGYPTSPGTRAEAVSLPTWGSVQQPQRSCPFCREEMIFLLVREVILVFGCLSWLR